MPEVIVSTVPAELLATEGEPQYTPIKDTNLLFVSNTESNIFMDTATQEHYALISGRWFKTKSLAEGPWSYVAPNQLPADFAKIPENSVKGFVLVNVAGTPQAKEAVLENSIPQTATIDRKKATTKVNYAGEPKFDKIADTNLEYAVNTGTAVFKEGTKYYAVDQGVWYEADSPNGPWTVSVNPPKEVDKIPPSNPRYNAKYVKVYESTDDTVTVGYTPGYTGSYVDNGTVVYGTGYDYSGYSTPEAYIPPPTTYGYAAAYDPYAGVWGYETPYYDPGSWLVAGLGAWPRASAVAAIADNWWGHGYGSWGGGGWWGAGGYNNININNIHNNVINRGRGRATGTAAGSGPEARSNVPGGRPPCPPNRRNLYNRPGNENRLASRPGQPGTRPGGGVLPAVLVSGRKRPGARPGRPGQAARPKAETRPAQAARPAQPKVRPAGGRTTSWPTETAMSINATTRATGSSARGTSGPNPGRQTGARPAAGARPAQPGTQARRNPQRHARRRPPGPASTAVN